MKYSKVKKEFEEAGFTNIKKKEIADLSKEKLDKKNIVTSIKINDKDDFDKDDKFFVDNKVVIEYHTAKKIKPPYDDDEAEGKPYEDVVKKFEKAGFTNIITEERIASEFFNEEVGTVADIYIDGICVSDKNKKYKPDVEVRIDYYVKGKSYGRSSSELTEFYAQKAFEEYGKSKYRYGFKCHWIMDLINSEQTSDGTWIFKVGVTIENASGNKYDAIAEGKVSGTDANPKVKDFYVN